MLGTITSNFLRLKLKNSLSLIILLSSSNILLATTQVNSQLIFIKNINITISIISILLFTLLLVSYFYFKQRERINLIAAEKEKTRLRLEFKNKQIELRMLALKNQLNPHFVFNILNSIGSIIIKEDRIMVYDLFAKFTSLIRHSIENSDKIAIPLKEELEVAKYYLELQKFRFKDKFEFNFYISEDVDKSMLVPRMCIEIFIENSIKHGLKNLKKQGLLNIDITQTEKYLDITIRDNGIGRENAKKFNNFSTGKGINIAKEIFEVFESIQKKKVELEIIDLYNDVSNTEGTKVNIKVMK